jgi:hypothetical protein
MRKDVPLAVEVPSPDRDKPAWVKVGVIAAVGFVIGIAWPRIVGVRLGPSAPGESTSSAASSASAGRAPEAPPASVAAKTTAASGATPSASAPAAVPAEKAAAPSAAPAAAAAAAPPKITVTKGNVLSCKTADGEKKTGKDCGPVAGLDLVVKPRVQSIATCSGVEGQTGKLALVVNADFNTGRFWYDVSKSTNVPNVEAITSCLKTSFHKTSVDKGVPHEHARYTVSYTATLTPADGSSASASAAKAKTDKGADKPAAPSEDEAPALAPAPAKQAAAGEAAVAWEVALVRDQPKVGGVVARLPRGTKVKLGSMKEGWYAIKFGDDYGSDGWVYRGAVGR